MKNTASYVVTAGLNQPVYYSNQGDAMKAARSYITEGEPMTTLTCMYGNTPDHDCGARACPIHGTPSASPYGKRQGAQPISATTAWHRAYDRAIVTRDATLAAHLRDLSSREKAQYS